MEHLKFCVSEILAAKELLAVQNSSFFSRSIARMVAIRNDDFIKSSFRVNKANAKLKRIKDDTNALQAFYNDHLALQRNKFGAHFQELDFVKRFDCWQNINYESSAFFTEMPEDIYKLFAAVADYETPGSLVTSLSQSEKDMVALHNEHSDLEKYPTLGVDTLALARHNTGGLLHGTITQQKAATLKTLEIIIAYDIGLLRSLNGNSNYEALVKKMLITDIVSYADNFISRIDLLPGAPQEENGLDILTKDNGFHNASSVIEAFLSSYRFHQELATYREVRNKCCGHIDTTIPVVDLKLALAAVDISGLVCFYEMLQNTFRQVCSRDFLLQTFCIEPGERIHDAVSMTGIKGLKSYSGKAFVNEEPLAIEVDDEELYEERLESFIEHRNEESRKFFYSCFARSELIETVTMTFGNETFSQYRRVEIRKAHMFFKNILLDVGSSVKKKQGVLQLFSACAHGYPNSLLKIILETYLPNSVDIHLNSCYLHAIGELCHDESLEVRELLSSNLMDKTFLEVYHALLGLFKIDVFSLRNRTGHFIETAWSPIIIKTIHMLKPRAKCLMALGLLSNFHFVTRSSHLEKKIKGAYIGPLEAIIHDYVEKELVRMSKKPADKRDIRHIKSRVNLRAYATLCALIGDFYEGKKNKDASRFFWNAIYEGWVIFSRANFTELHNYAAICYKLQDFDNAILVAEDIVARNPWDIDRRYSILCFYLADKKYLEKFDREKKYLLENFSLLPKMKKAIENLAYPEL